jgi:hypothetical protein
MNRKDLDSLNELYLSVYDGEQLNEAPLTPEQIKYKNERAQLGVVSKGGKFVATGKVDPKLTSDWEWMTSSQAGKRQQLRAQKLAADLNKGQQAAKPAKPVRASSATLNSLNDTKTQNLFAQDNNPQVKKSLVPGAQPAGSPPSRPAPPKPSGPVLSKKNGVEGTGVGANFKARAFSAAEKSRYSSVAAKNAASSAAPKPATEKSPQGYSVGTTAGGTKFERRTPTRKEMDAAKGAGGGEAGVKAAVAAGQPTTGPANATVKPAGGTFAPRDMSKYPLKPAPTPTATPAPARNGFGASTAGANAAASVSSATAPALPGQNSINNTKTNPTIMKQSYEWPSAKTIRDIAGAYSSIYEAKKKVDQDQDGDNDFADVRVARMIASGVPKAKAIAMVKDKSYNEEVELWVNELLEEGYDLSEYTWEDMFEIYEEIEYIEERDEGKPGLMFKKIAAKAAKKYGSKEAGNRVAGAIRKKVLANEATAMTKRGYDETEIRNKIAKSTGGGEAADRATELENRPTFGNKSKQEAREKLARTQRGDFRRTTSSDYGLRLGAHKSNDPAVKAKQAARGKQRSALTPREKKMLNREAYETYEFVASYLLENNFASTVDDANVIINNMSEGWFESIMEEKKPLPVSKMKRKEEKLDKELESELPKALRTEIDSPERKKLLGKNRRFGDMHDVRRSVSTRGGKRPLQMPEVGRYKPKDED